jgi:hypothetical protein
MKRFAGGLLFAIILAMLLTLFAAPAIAQAAGGQGDVASVSETGAAEDTRSLIYYLFLPACNSCANAHTVIDQLNDSVMVTRNGESFESVLTVKAIDMSKEPRLAELLFERYQVPQDKQYAPIVFLGDEYMAGDEAIKADLSNDIAQGMALGTPVILQDAGKADRSALTLAGTIGAGLVGGLNPCALSMLLMLLMVLANMGRRAGIYAAAFLGAKFATYLLLGTVLLGAFQLWNPTWLPVAIKWLLTGLGGAVIALNLWDCHAAKQERYGSIRNQLPGKWRKFLHDKIQALADAKHLLPVSIMLGVLVAAGEFLCAGQLYLATLLSGLQSGADTVSMIPMLILYCLCFLMPSILLVTAVVRGKAAFSLLEIIRAKMPLIKLLSAAVMLLILVFIWL